MRIVVKVGTSTLAYSTGHLNIRHMEKLCRVLSDVKNSGHEIILVSSGAVGMGMGKLSLTERPSELSMKQAVAAVGQCELMYVYDKLFSEYNHTVAQVLLSADDVNDSEHRDNFISTMETLLTLRALPIINENDTVATAEIRIGDNDTLAAVVASSVGADLLILLSDIDGLYTADPRRDPSAKLIPKVEKITDEVEALAGVSRALPSLMRAKKLAKRARKASLPTMQSPLDFDALLASVPEDRRGEWIGNALFALADAAGRNGLEPEQLLGGTCDKMIQSCAEREKAK